MSTGTDGVKYPVQEVETSTKKSVSDHGDSCPVSTASLALTLHHHSVQEPTVISKLTAVIQLATKSGLLKSDASSTST